MFDSVVGNSYERCGESTQLVEQLMKEVASIVANTQAWKNRCVQ